jgi:predicted ABC-type ATPase
MTESPQPTEEQQARAPVCIVIAGPNGAGRTTSSRALLAETLRVLTFVNADVIAQGLACFDPDRAAFEAGRVMLERLNALAAQRYDFAFETTRSGKTYAGWLRGLRDDGYGVHLVYFWLESADLAVARVAERVRAGGHNIPVATIRQRYRRSVHNFWHLYRPVVSTWRLYDNTQTASPRLVAHGDESGGEQVLDEACWRRI